MRADIQDLLQPVRDYVKEALSHKWEISIGVLVSMVLFVISTIYLFEGVDKRFILYSAPCLMTGVFFFLIKL